MEMRKDGDWWRKNARKYKRGDAMAIPERNAITKEGDEMNGSWRWKSDEVLEVIGIWR